MLSKTVALFCYSIEFHQLSEQLVHFWRFENEKQLKDKFHRRLTIIHKASKIYLSYSGFGLCVLLILIIFSSRELLVYVYVPHFLSANFILAFECVMIPLLTLNINSFDFLVFIFLQLTLIQFQLLESAIGKLNFKQDQNHENCKAQLDKIIEHQIFLLNFTDKLKNIMSFPLLIQILNTILAVCVELYALRNE